MDMSVDENSILSSHFSETDRLETPEGKDDDWPSPVISDSGNGTEFQKQRSVRRKKKRKYF